VLFHIFFRIPSEQSEVWGHYLTAVAIHFQSARLSFNLSASRKKTFPAPSLNMTRKNVILTATR
jgi:hypothetical protein